MSLINYVTKIHFAENVLEDALEAELEFLDVARPLVVADDVRTRPALLDRLLAAMPRRVSASVFECEPSRATEQACSEAARTFVEADADGIIGFGGAAAINLAKAIGVRVGHAGPLRRYSGLEGGRSRIRDVIPPIVAIPTNSGSCSETSGIAVVATEDGPVSLSSPCLTPRVVICDPTLTLDLPADRTAAAGMDALTHCVETFTATAYNPPADGIALDGLRRVVANLDRVVDDGGDLEARREMMAGALNGALAHQKGLGGVHAMSHALGGITGAALDHGAVNGVLLPHVLVFNAPAVASRYDEIRREWKHRARADLPDVIVRMRERLGLPASLGEMGVTACEISRAAVLAESDDANRTNPRRADADDYLSMMKAAM